MKSSSVLFVCVMSTVGGMTAGDDGSVTPERTWPARVYTKENPPRLLELEELPLVREVTQYGITWTFERSVRVGRFVNGDYYVVGPLTIIRIAPKPLWGDEVGEIIDKSSVRESRYPGKQARNGSVLNVPSRRKKGGYDSRIPSERYDPKLFAHVPIQMKPGDVLVSTVSRRNEEIKKFSGQHVDPLRVAATLACVAEPQPPDAFRPSYCDSARSKIYLARNLRRDLLLNLPRPASAPETLGGYAGSFKKPWLDTVDFAYVDRWMTEDDAPFVEEIKKAGGSDYTGVERGRFGRQGHVWGPKFVRHMWETYRNNLPPTPDGHQTPPAKATWR